MLVKNYREKYRSHASLTDGDIVGVEFNDGERVFVEKLSDTEYITAGLNSLGGRRIKGTSVPHLLEEIASVKNIYTFDSRKEVFEWIIGKD